MATTSEYVINLNEDGTEALSFAPLDQFGAGWARYFSPGVPRGNRVLLRIGFVDRPEADQPPSGSLGVRELHFFVGGQLAAQIVRDLPFGRIANAVNQPRHYEILSQHVEWLTSLPKPKPGLWESELPELIPDPAPDLRIAVPTGQQRRSDEFYLHVANAFAWLSAHGTRPAAELAEANDVPVTTVHRWVKEARARGVMPPAAGRGRRGTVRFGGRHGSKELQEWVDEDARRAREREERAEDD